MKRLVIILVLISLGQLTIASNKFDSISTPVDTLSVTILALQNINILNNYGRPIDSLRPHLPDGYTITGVWGYISGVLLILILYNQVMLH